MIKIIEPGEDPKSMIGDLIAARKDMPVIAHDKDMPVGWDPKKRAQATATYTTLETVLAIVTPIALKHNFVITCSECVLSGHRFVRTTALHSSGGWVSSLAPTPEPGTEKFKRAAGTDKEKEIVQEIGQVRYGGNTSGFRYGLRNLFGLIIAGEEDIAAKPWLIGGSSIEPDDQPRQAAGNQSLELVRTDGNAIMKRLMDAVDKFRQTFGNDWDQSKVLSLLPEAKPLKRLAKEDIDYIGKEYVRRKAEMETAQ